jgi:methylated-DNA-[protein]-cysteine S-methyltransferase
MVGSSYTVFDTLVGRCGLAWSHSGIVGVQLPEAREIETRRQLLRRFPEAREVRPPPDIETAIDGIVMLLRGQPSDFSDVTLNMQGIAPFNRKVYDFLRTIPRGETLTYSEIAARLGASGASHAVGQAIGRNPFTLIVPCHRALEAAGNTSGISANGGVITKFRLLSLEGALAGRGPTLFDVLLSVDRPRPRG